MRKASLLAALACCSSCGVPQTHSAAGPTRGVPTAPIAVPPGGEALGFEWRSARAAGVGTILMAVARPAGAGPFPAVVILHGSHGFAREYVQLAKELSRDGFVAVAACWFAPGRAHGMRFVSPLRCPPETPPMSANLSDEAARTIDLVVRSVRSLPDVQADRIALFGHSRGGGAAWDHVLRGGHARAIILNSAGYPDELIRRAARFDAPVLILHGERDDPRDGGGAMTDVARARAFHAALRRANRPVEAMFYPRGRHNDLFADPRQHADQVRRMRAFLRKYLRAND